nr:MAG TPA: hypothetical protein [Bacteriophage sp.]
MESRSVFRCLSRIFALSKWPYRGESERLVRHESHSSFLTEYLEQWSRV